MEWEDGLTPKVLAAAPHNASTSCPVADEVPVSPTLVAPGPGACPTVLLAASSPWYPYLPAWDLSRSLVLPHGRHGRLPASCLLVRLGGSPPVNEPQMGWEMGRGERLECVSVGLVGCELLYWG